ncbi:MAG: hypothetical protein ABIM50_15740 [Novosphingobium sp.]
MRKTVSIATIALLGVALAGCSKPANAPEASASSEAAAPSAAATWTPALPAPGKYEVTNADGTPSGKVDIRADYGYTNTPAKGTTESGIVKLTDGKVCFDPSGKTAPTRCYTESVRAADGSFTATNDKGVTVNVRPAAK